jgi:hypothetical protein
VILRGGLFQPNLVIAVAGLDCDFVFPGKPPDGHEKQAFGHPCSFDQRCERGWTTVGKHVPHGTGCFSDRTEFAALRVAPRARGSDGKDGEKRCRASQ